MKAIIIRRSGQRNGRTDYFRDINEAQHDINRLLDCLSADQGLRLPREVHMCDVVDSRNSKEKRALKSGQINQMWRYGGRSTGDLTDRVLEEKLLKIHEWITRQLI